MVCVNMKDAVLYIYIPCTIIVYSWFVSCFCPKKVLLDLSVSIHNKCVYYKLVDVINNDNKDSSMQDYILCVKQRLSSSIILYVFPCTFVFISGPPKIDMLIAKFNARTLVLIHTLHIVSWTTANVFIVKV